MEVEDEMNRAGGAGSVRRAPAPPTFPMQTPPPLPGKQPTDWWGRNWKWFTPLTAAIVLAAIGGFVAAIMGLIKSSDAYTGALARARSAPAVIDAIGTPIKDGFLVSGNINVSGTTGAADLAIPVSGPKGSASIVIQASKSLGVWHFDHMIVQVDATQQRIDLSEYPARNGPSSP
jgi:hypothetical protein